ncbi:MAG TPA: ferrochelatase, partial [Mycobacteriales bacterium]|nr:ferrochelatase [Mycobacteriales bacterium]
HARSEIRAAPLVTKLRHYYAEDGFLTPIARGVAAELAQVGPDAHLLFTAHSLPTAGAAAAGPEGGAYVAALRTAAAGVVARLGASYSWDLVFQSRSGPPHISWLEPDVGDRLQELAATGTREVVLVPIGFLSDHVEVLYDLDHVAVSQVPGLVVRRAPTVGVAPEFVSMIRGLIAERIAGPERSDHGGVATHDRCPAHCCLPAAKAQAGSA